jgi:hypothetical protein
MRTAATLPPATVGALDCPWMRLRKLAGSWLTLAGFEGENTAPGVPAAGPPTGLWAPPLEVAAGRSGEVPGRCLDGEAELETIPTARLPPTCIGAVPARIAAAAAITADSSGADAEAAAAAAIAADTPPAGFCCTDNGAPPCSCRYGDPPRFASVSEEGRGPTAPLRPNGAPPEGVWGKKALPLPPLRDPIAARPVGTGPFGLPWLVTGRFDDAAAYGDEDCACVVLGLLDDAAWLLVNPFSPLLRMALRLEGTSNRLSLPSHHPPVGISPETVEPGVPPSSAAGSTGRSSGMAPIRVTLGRGVANGGSPVDDGEVATEGSPPCCW